MVHCPLCHASVRLWSKVAPSWAESSVPDCGAAVEAATRSRNKVREMAFILVSLGWDLRRRKFTMRAGAVARLECRGEAAVW